MNEKGNLTTGSVFKRLAGFAVPFLFASFMQAFYGAVDMWTVGNFSTTAALSAVNVGAQVTQIVTGFCVGVSMGTTVLIGHNIGAKHKKGAARALGNSVWLFVIMALILTPAMIVFSNPIAAVMHTPTEAVAEASLYIRICGIGVPFIITYNVISAILRGDGNSTMPMIFVGIACAVNVAGDLLLTGLLKMGVTGVPIAGQQ